MGWQTIDLTEINPQLEIIPEGRKFTWELLPGAKYSERDPETIECQAAIVNDSEFSGRRIYFRYDPDKVKALKRLEVAMGVDASKGEDPVAFLNRAAGNRFQTSVRHTKPSDEYPNPKAFLQLWNVEPAA